MRAMAVGEKLVVQADKKSVPRDLEAFARTTGNRFLGAENEGGVWRITLERLPGSRLGPRDVEGFDA